MYWQLLSILFHVDYFLMVHFRPQELLEFMKNVNQGLFLKAKSLCYFPIPRVT